MANKNKTAAFAVMWRILPYQIVLTMALFQDSILSEVLLVDAKLLVLL